MSPARIFFIHGSKVPMSTPNQSPELEELEDSSEERSSQAPRMPPEPWLSKLPGMKRELNRSEHVLHARAS